MFGQGLIKGLKVTLRHIWGPKITQLYPEEKPVLPPRTRASFCLDEEKCTACGICSTACPNRVITVEAERGEDGKRRPHPSYYHLDLKYCLFCGMCAEVCPFSALHVTSEFEHAQYRREDIYLELVPRKEGTI